VGYRQIGFLNAPVSNAASTCRSRALSSKLGASQYHCMFADFSMWKYTLFPHIQQWLRLAKCVHPVAPKAKASIRVSYYFLQRGARIIVSIAIFQVLEFSQCIQCLTDTIACALITLITLFISSILRGFIFFANSVNNHISGRLTLFPTFQQKYVQPFIAS